MQQTSNYRELGNLVHTLEDGVASGRLSHSEVWIFTGNTTAEGVFWKGHSPYPHLNKLALRLRLLEMDGLVRSQMVHVPGTRMISQGTDGLSRGDLAEGVMTGQSILQHVPVRYSAVVRQPSLLQWLSSWLPATPFILEPSQWSVEGHGVLAGSVDQFNVWHPPPLPFEWYLWTPPPALGDVAVEELEASRHKRAHLSHVFLCPHLMTFAWRKKLLKICDLVFSVPPGLLGFWPESEHKPLIVSLTLRFCPSSPWQVKHYPEFLALAGQLPTLWASLEAAEQNLLRQLCLAPQWLGGMLECLVP
jgi:hypothetical protein